MGRNKRLPGREGKEGSAVVMRGRRRTRKKKNRRRRSIHRSSNVKECEEVWKSMGRGRGEEAFGLVRGQFQILVALVQCTYWRSTNVKEEDK